MKISVQYRAKCCGIAAAAPGAVAVPAFCVVVRNLNSFKITTLRRSSASSQSQSTRNLRNRLVVHGKTTESDLKIDSPMSSYEIDCIGTGLDVECVVSPRDELSEKYEKGFLAEGLERTTAGLGSVIIDSQPLIVAILASLLFGESIGYIGVAGLVLGVIGLLLLEVPSLAFDANNFSLWGSGEWWMFLAAQSMAIGTVMVRWVSKYSDPVMATGWHMVIGGLPLVAISILNHDPGLSSFHELTTDDALALLYTSIFGSAISYGLYFYNASRGSLTKLSSLTFLTPMFASVFGFIYLGETFTPLQLVGALVTVAGIYMVNYKSESE